MKAYIDKTALIAEIERRIDEVNQIDKASYEVGLFDAYKIILSFLDTLEVKEVDAEKEFENEDLINLHKACEWVRKKFGEEAVVNFCKAMEE